VEDDERTVSTDVPLFDALPDAPSSTSISSSPPSTEKSVPVAFANVANVPAPSAASSKPPGPLPMLETAQPDPLRALARTMMGIAPQAAPRPAVPDAPGSRASVAVPSLPSDSAAAYRGNRYVDPCEATTIAPPLGQRVAGADIAAVDAANLIVPVETHSASSDPPGVAQPRVFAWGREPDPSAEVDPQIVSNEQFEPTFNQALPESFSSQPWAPAQGTPAQGGTVPMPPMGAGYGGSVTHGGSAFGGVPAPRDFQSMQGESPPGAQAASMAAMQPVSHSTWGGNAQQPMHLSHPSWGPQPFASTAPPESVRGSRSMVGFVVFVVLCLAIFLAGAVLFVSTKC